MRAEEVRLFRSLLRTVVVEFVLRLGGLDVLRVEPGNPWFVMPVTRLM